MLGEDRWSCGAVGEALLAWGPGQMVLAWGHQIFADMQRGHLEGRGIEGRWFVWGTVQPPGDVGCVWRLFQLSQLGERLHLVRRGQGTVKHPSTYRMTPECCWVWGQGTQVLARSVC